MPALLPNYLKLFFLKFGLLFFGTFCAAQHQQGNNAFWDNVRFGGGVGLGWTNGGFSGSIAPSAVYQFNPFFAAGLGANVNFYKFNNQKFWAYGPSALILANPIPQIQLSGEFEQLRVNASVQAVTGNFTNDYWSPALFIGAGYTTDFATVGIRYNVLHDNDKSIYLNAWVPFVRVYF